MSKTVTIIGAVSLALLVVVLVVQLLLVVPSLGALGPGAEQTGIMVMGEGKASAQPDVAMVNIGVETRSATAKGAADANKEQMADVMEALQGMGIAEEDIQTADYTIYPEMQWSEDEPPRVIGYVASNSLLVKIRQIDQVGDVLDAVTEAGANNIYGIQFTIDDPSSLREQARAEAMADAQSKAQALADLAGVGLGKPRLISESFVEVPIPYPAVERAPMGGGVEVPVSPGQLEISVSVQVTFDVR